jgi:hypothetical protein
MRSAGGRWRWSVNQTPASPWGLAASSIGPSGDAMVLCTQDAGFSWFHVLGGVAPAAGACPGAHHRVAAPGAPGARQALGFALGRSAKVPGQAHRPGQCHVAHRPGIRPAQRPHGDVVRGPGTDAGQGEQGLPGAVRVGVGVRSSWPSPRLAPVPACAACRWRTMPSSPSTAGSMPGQPGRGGKQARHRRVRRDDGFAQAFGQARASALAAPRDTCWPRMARTPVSKPSKLPGTRMPLPPVKSGSSRASMTAMSVSRSSQWRTRQMT